MPRGEAKSGIAKRDRFLAGGAVPPALEIETPEPGWKMEIYGTRSEPTDEWPSDIWTKLGGGAVEKKKQSFPLDTGDRRYRYYLVWITKLSRQGRDHAAHLSAPKG